MFLEFSEADCVVVEYVNQFMYMHDIFKLSNTQRCIFFHNMNLLNK